MCDLYTLRFKPSQYAPYYFMVEVKGIVSSYKESCNNKPIYGYMLPNLVIVTFPYFNPRCSFVCFIFAFTLCETIDIIDT